VIGFCRAREECHVPIAGHFALDEKTDEIARLILDFMAKQPG
jgi:hypothetical protein